jgi:hypothetical protein
LCVVCSRTQERSLSSGWVRGLYVDNKYRNQIAKHTDLEDVFAWMDAQEARLQQDPRTQNGVELEVAKHIRCDWVKAAQREYGVVAVAAARKAATEDSKYVRIDGLKSFPLLNGLVARRKVWHEEDGRWEVRICDPPEGVAGTVRVKPSNLTSLTEMDAKALLIAVVD